MDDPEIKTEGSGPKRYVSVLFRTNPAAAEFVSVRFIDPENPDETNRAERERFVAKAREIMARVAAST